MERNKLIGTFVSLAIPGLCVIEEGGVTLSHPAKPGICVYYFDNGDGGVDEMKVVIPASTEIIDHRNGQESNPSSDS